MTEHYPEQNPLTPEAAAIQGLTTEADRILAQYPNQPLETYFAEARHGKDASGVNVFVDGNSVSKITLADGSTKYEHTMLTYGNGKGDISATWQPGGDALTKTQEDALGATESYADLAGMQQEKARLEAKFPTPVQEAATKPELNRRIRVANWLSGRTR